MAIIGRGNIASVLTDRSGALFFASGVSNSRKVETESIMREKNRLWGILEKLTAYERDTVCIFYFSSIGITFQQNPYYDHKLRMEAMVKTMFSHYVILRIGNLIGDTNPNTFINYIHNRQAQGLSVEIRDEYKYMIDGQTLNTLCQTLPLNQKIELTVATKIAKVKDLI